MLVHIILLSERATRILILMLEKSSQITLVHIIMLSELLGRATNSNFYVRKISTEHPFSLNFA